jgi:hypothetical protein
LEAGIEEGLRILAENGGIKMETDRDFVVAFLEEKVSKAALRGQPRPIDDKIIINSKVVFEGKALVVTKHEFSEKTRRALSVGTDRLDPWQEPFEESWGAK